jgi:hypothetical protein
MACHCRRRFCAEASGTGKARARQDRAAARDAGKQDLHSAGGEARDLSCHLYARVDVVNTIGLGGLGLGEYRYCIDVLLKSGAAVAISDAGHRSLGEGKGSKRANEQTSRRVADERRRVQTAVEQKPPAMHADDGQPAAATAAFCPALYESLQGATCRPSTAETQRSSSSSSSSGSSGSGGNESLGAEAPPPKSPHRCRVMPQYCVFSLTLSDGRSITHIGRRPCCSPLAASAGLPAAPRTRPAPAKRPLPAAAFID